MNVYLGILVGLIVTFLLGYGVKPLLEHAKKDLHLTPPNEALKDKWAELTGGNEAGGIIGTLERFFFFGAFWAMRPPQSAHGLHSKSPLSGRSGAPS